MGEGKEIAMMTNEELDAKRWTLGVGRSELEARVHLLIEEVKRLRAEEPHRMVRELTAALGHVQDRCTTLLLENRHLRQVGEMAAVFRRVRAERAKQNAKWDRIEGRWEVSDAMKYIVLAEEVGEVARALQDVERRPHGDLAPCSRDAHLRDELTQVAAVAVQWLETMVTPDEAQGKDGGT